MDASVSLCCWSACGSIPPAASCNASVKQKDSRNKMASPLHVGAPHPNRCPPHKPKTVIFSIPALLLHSYLRSNLQSVWLNFRYFHFRADFVFFTVFLTQPGHRLRAVLSAIWGFKVSRWDGPGRSSSEVGWCRGVKGPCKASLDLRNKWPASRRQ